MSPYSNAFLILASELPENLMKKNVSVSRGPKTDFL